MVGGTHEQVQQQSHPPMQAPITAEEEALKRNTDCVYFLASPLTCKKGSECEYRHSDIARLNPRDCWYWLNGNCLNPKCGFRHPPLDGLLGTQLPAPVTQSLPPQSVAAPPAQAPFATDKQTVPCIFFQKGYCMKGDICPFMHAPYYVNNKISPAAAAAATTVTESQSQKKPSVGLAKCNQEQNVSRDNVSKSVASPLHAISAIRTEMPPLRNGIAISKNTPLPTGVDDEIPRYRPANVHSAGDGNSLSRSNRIHQVQEPDDQGMLSSKDADEFSREPSPGFDVLVDDELRDSDYYPNEQFGRTRDHEGGNLNAINEYGHSTDYNSMADVDRDIYHDSQGYDSYERLQGRYGWEENKVSSERMLGISAHEERRRHPRADNADRIDELDLRHHLSKQKKGNGLRSVINHDHVCENRVDSRSSRAPRRDHLPGPESSISSRLRGRIKIPVISESPVYRKDSWSERENERTKYKGKLSPERLQGRLRDRIKGRVPQDFNHEERNFRGPRIRRDIATENNAEFSGPKSLAELKVGKNSESHERNMNDHPLLGKRKYPKMERALQKVEGDISFEGPKPLSEILKRKKGGEVADYDNGRISTNVGDNQSEGKVSFKMPIGTKETKGSAMSSAEVSRVNLTREESKHTAGEGGTEEKMKITEGQSSQQLGIEEGMIGDDALEYNEPEAYDHREGYSDYEQADGEDYNLDEGENVDTEEYFEEDDADDFAKKMGVMYS